MLDLTILVLTIFWLLSFFSKSLFPEAAYRNASTDILAMAIILLIVYRFLT